MLAISMDLSTLVGIAPIFVGRHIGIFLQNGRTTPILQNTVDYDLHHLFSIGNNLGVCPRNGPNHVATRKGMCRSWPSVENGPPRPSVAVGVL